MSVSHEGGCLCGKVRYKVAAEPLRVTICHCTFCQRFTGSAFLVEPIFRTEDVVFSGTAPRTYGHRSDGSDKCVTLNFCGRCGTTFLSLVREISGIHWRARGNVRRSKLVRPRTPCLSPHLYPFGAARRRPSGRAGGLPRACNATRRDAERAERA